MIAAQIINDTVDLMKDIVRDMYMFRVSYDYYNNGVSFMPQYYFENMLLHADMIWERIIIILAIAYQIDFQIIFEKKGIGSLYDIIKKDNRIDTSIKKLLQEINADYKMRDLKMPRNGNEHYISTHLAENDEIKTNLENLTYIKNGELHGDIKKINEQTDKINRKAMGLLKKKIMDVSKKQRKYIELLKLCILQMESAFKSNTFSFNQITYFLPDYDMEMYIYDNVCVICQNLEAVYAKLREDFRKVVDRINESVYAAMANGSRTRNTLLTDSLFRAKEIIRSINMYYRCTRFCIYDGQESEPKQKELFEKYCCNEVIFSYYYYDHAILKFYSVYEKLAKFLLCKYDFNQEYLEEKKFKGMYIDNIIKMFKEKGITSKIIVKFRECVSSLEYKEYEKIRNRDYHCLRTFYIFDEKSIDMVINAYISKMVKMMYALSELFSLIIEEENQIYTKMIFDMKSKETTLNNR